ncbi:MAG: murein endopeptidase [Myxococcota bacterium]
MRTLIASVISVLCLLVVDARAENKKPRLAYPGCVHQLKSGSGFTVRTPKRAYGTKKAIRLFKKAVASVRKKFRKTATLPVGDLSYRGGGRMRPHRSHRDGRDMDVGYYFKDGRSRNWFAKARAKTLDVPRTWALFKALIATREVEFIFVAYPLQRALYRYALKHGETKKSLNRVFQWPRSRRKKAGIIRLERGHADHFHVRFKKSRRKNRRAETTVSREDNICGS